MPDCQQNSTILTEFLTDNLLLLRSQPSCNTRFAVFSISSQKYFFFLFQSSFLGPLTNFPPKPVAVTIYTTLLSNAQIGLGTQNSTLGLIRPHTQCVLWLLLWNNQQMSQCAVKFYFSAGPLYMFRAAYTPIIRSTILTVSTAIGTIHTVRNINMYITRI